MIDSLQQLREQYDALRLRRDVAALEQQIAWEEQAARRVELREGWGELVNPRESEFDSPGFGLERIAARPSRVEDRQQGRNAPHFETEEDLARIRGLARWLASTDETTIGVLENLTNYVIGTGFTYTAVERAPGAAPRGLVDAVQQFIDELREQCGWRRLEREAFLRSRRDGEFFLLLERNGSQPRLRFVEPDVVRKPDDPRFMSHYAGAYDLDWEFGVATAIGDAEQIHGYHLDWSGDGRDWEFVPAERMEHAKVNVDSGVKRGLSDFYAAAAEIEQAAKLARNTAEGAAIQATIAYIKEAALGAGRSEIESHRSSHADWTTPPAPDGGRRNVRFEKFFPGRVITTAGMKYHAGPLGTSNAPTFIEVIQMVLRRVGQRWSMPEYMVSGDASNANYASTLVAESPFVKSAEAKQMWYEEAFRSLFWKALRLAHGDRVLSRWNVDFPRLRQLVKLRLEAPRVSVRNRAEETKIRSDLHAAGLLSRRTWAALEELDFDVEQEHLAREM
ncbi:MAG: phage portal protein [Pirellulaceae bacterium]